MREDVYYVRQVGSYEMGAFAPPVTAETPVVYLPRPRWWERLWGWMVRVWKR